MPQKPDTSQKNKEQPRAQNALETLEWKQSPDEQKREREEWKTKQTLHGRNPRQPRPVDPEHAPTKQGRKKPAVSTIRTYEDDVARAMREKKHSVASIAVAQQKKKKEQEASQAPKGSLIPRLIVSLVTLLVVAGGGYGGFWWYTNNVGNAPPAQPNNGQSTDTPRVSYSGIFPVDHSYRVSRADMNLEEIVATATRQDFSQNTFTEIQIVDAQDQPIAADTLLAEWSHTMPNILTRSIDDTFSLIVYTTVTQGVQWFLIFDATNISGATAGLLQWEGDIAHDLALLGVNLDTTATATYVDAVIHSFDVRRYTNTQGEFVTGYSLPTRSESRFLITGFENALVDGLAELSK